MSVEKALSELRRKRQHVDRAIRALELLQELEQTGDAVEPSDGGRRTGTSNLIQMPRSREG